MLTCTALPCHINCIQMLSDKLDSLYMSSIKVVEGTLHLLCFATLCLAKNHILRSTNLKLHGELSTFNNRSNVIVT
jgi:hypothetical protein